MTTTRTTITATTIATRTTTATTTMIMQRGKFSSTYSVLLFSALLLMTKSCGIVALSVEGSGALASDAGAWNGSNAVDTTTELPSTTTESWSEGGETGSGWEPIITTIAPESEPEPTTTEQSSTAANEVDTTVAPEADTTAAPEADTTVSEPQETTTEASGNGAETSPSSTSEDTPVSTTTAAEIVTSTTEAEVVITTTIAPAPPSFECSAAGLFEHISGDCQRYHQCWLNPLTRQLEASEVLCPAQTAYSATYGRCTRDLASCDDGFTCSAVGRFAGSDNSYYINCVSSLAGGYHKYRVRCSSGERFEPALGGCWRFEWSHLTPGAEALEASDLAAIKREQKQFKAEEKLRQKALKVQEKQARKQQQELEKQAKKAAKELAKAQAKAQKEQAKQPQLESAESDQSDEEQEQPQPENFQCVREGNFARVNVRQYFACVSQKGQLLTLQLECASGQEFDASKSACAPISSED